MTAYAVVKVRKTVGLRYFNCRSRWHEFYGRSQFHRAADTTPDTLSPQNATVVYMN